MRSNSEKNGYVDISTGSSAVFNKYLRTMTRDIVRGFNLVRESEKEIDTLNKVMSLENAFLNNKLKYLTEELNSVKNDFDSINNKDENFNKRIPLTYGGYFINNDSYFDATYGMITLPYVDVQRTTMESYPRDFLTKNTNISIKYEVFNGDILEREGVLDNTSDIVSIIDGNNNTVFMRSVFTNNLATKVRFTVNVSLPAKILTSLYVNSIGIRPHPPYCLNLISTKIIDATTKTKSDVIGYSETSLLGNNMDSIDSVKMMFPTKKISSVELVFEQQVFIGSGDNREWIIGFKGIDISNMKLTSEISTFFVKLNCPYGHYFKQISKPTPVSALLDNTSVNSNVSFELLYEKDDEISFEFDTDIPTNKNTVYLKCTMSGGDIIPALSAIDVSYTVK